VNIKNLMNIIFAGPTKSKIKILQSIGRGLRKLDGKEICTVYDIADDFRSGKKSPNTTLNHFLERVKIYTREKFNFTIREVIWTI
jgi:superfamily II DNA or RNA helicase